MKTGVIYLADYSPDAVDPDPLRGPAGQGKWTIVRRPSNYGWPYCATNQHGHSISTAQGCIGSFDTPPLDSAHAGEQLVGAVFIATYTDAPPVGVPPLTGQAVVVLLPSAPAP